MVELDLAFEPEAVAAGLERLFAARGLKWSRRAGGARRAEFTIVGPSAGDATVSVEPLPAQRMTYPSFFPRTLLQLASDDQAALERLRRDILLAFMRVMG